MAYTAQDLITDVLLDMGVIAEEVTPTASQVVGALTKFNDLIESWNLDTTAVYGANQYILPLVAGQASYTIGAGGDLNVPRPTLITKAFVRQNNISPNNQTDYEIPVLTNQEWAEIPQKAATSTFPFFGVWFDNKFPLITANVSPVPTVGDYSLVFWADGLNSELTQFTVLELPPGYKRALKYALFIELAPSYQIQVTEEIYNRATTSKNQIDRYNLQINELEYGNGGVFNIYTNRFNS